jgi:quinoprotein glucose dehydrogenase
MNRCLATSRRNAMLEVKPCGRIAPSIDGGGVRARFLMREEMKLTRRTVVSMPAVSLLAGGLPALAQSGAAAPAAATAPDVEWRHYGANIASQKYSPLADINAGNFNSLQVAWRFKTDNFGTRPEGQFQSTPVMANGRLFTTAGTRRDVIALDPTNGEILWMHREDEGERARQAPRQLSGRGLSYWTDGAEERILYVTIGYRLISLDAKTGLVDRNFGDNGVVDLKQNIDQDLDLINADIGLHATPAVAGNVVIVGAAHDSGVVPPIRKNARGYVRGFDVKTGKRLWIFHTIPAPGEFGADTWTDQKQLVEAGNTGVWAQISVDEELGIAYLPVELPTGDAMGMYRHGAALFGESLVAVDLYTGVRKWHFQLVHHGLWDYDISCAPILCDIPVNGKIVKAVAQPTKQAFLYVFDRVTGKPIWPITEKKVPKGDVPGEWYSPTQPFPSKPPAYDRQGVSEADLIDFTPELNARAKEIVSHYRTGPFFTPPSVSKLDGKWGTLHLPNSQGGTNWPGGCYDPETYKVFVYSRTDVRVDALVPNSDPKISDFAYVRGNASQPVAAQRSMGEEGGPPRGLGQGGPPAAAGAPLRPGAVTVNGLPLIKPPYGRITAIDLSKGDIAWQVAHGATPDNVRNNPALKGLNIPRTGQSGNVGPMVTKTLVICGDPQMTTDEKGVRGARLRAYDKMTGEEKGAVYLPAPQGGTPMTYRCKGVQYLVIAVSGGGYNGELIAFRLPRA